MMTILSLVVLLHRKYEIKTGDAMEMYDVAIIGTGPAGMSAAVTAKIRNKKVLLIGNRKLSSKIEKGKKYKIILDFLMYREKSWQKILKGILKVFQ